MFALSKIVEYKFQDMFHLLSLHSMNEDKKKNIKYFKNYRVQIPRYVSLVESHSNEDKITYSIIAQHAIGQQLFK